MATRKKKSPDATSPTLNSAAADPVVDDKRQWVAELRRQLEDALAVMTAAAHTARDAATHEEMKAENEKDTRAIEAGYLAAGQSARALELRRALSDLADVRLGRVSVGGPWALLELEEEVRDAPVRTRVFLAPHASGQRMTSSGGAVQLISPASPLGQALTGKVAGDVVELLLGGRRRELSVLEVQ